MRSNRCPRVSEQRPPRAAAVPGPVAQAAEVLNAGSKVAILIGQGARDAAAEVREVAELTGAGIAKALLGKDVLPTTCRSSPARSACSEPGRATN